MIAENAAPGPSLAASSFVDSKDMLPVPRQPLFENENGAPRPRAASFGISKRRSWRDSGSAEQGAQGAERRFWRLDFRILTSGFRRWHAAWLGSCRLPMTDLADLPAFQDTSGL